jgi:MFS family permease
VCVTKDLGAFTAISFITAITTVTPQLMLPLVGDLAPPNKRAASLSIVTSGLLLGMLIARLLSGVLTNFTCEFEASEWPAIVLTLLEQHGVTYTGWR